MKFCKDCKWYEKNPNSTTSNNLDHCIRNKKLIEFDISYSVTGIKNPSVVWTITYAEIERSFHPISAFICRNCGKNARYFEPKIKEPVLDNVTCGKFM